MAVLVDNWTGAFASSGSLFGATWVAQTFVASKSYDLTAVKVGLHRQGTPGTCTLHIRNADGSGNVTGADITSDTFDGDVIPTSSLNEVEITLTTPPSLVSGQEYAIIISAPSGNSANKLFWYNQNGYTNGNYNLSTNSGVNWTQFTFTEFWFETYEAGTQSGTISGVGAMSGSAALALKAAGTISGIGATSGNATGVVAVSATVSGVGTLGASASVLAWRPFAMEDTSVRFTDVEITTPVNIYALSHNSFADVDANEHIDHSAVTITGAGLLAGQGGDITASRVFTLNNSDIDHGSISGLTDDDHSQYWAHTVTRTQNFLTSGNVECDSLTVAQDKSRPYQFSSRTGDFLVLQSQSAGPFSMEFYTFDGDGADNMFWRFIMNGDPATNTINELLDITGLASTDQYRFWARTVSGSNYYSMMFQTSGSGGTNTNQLLLNTDGSINMDAGDVDITGGDLDITTGDLTLTTGNIIVSNGTLTVNGLSELGNVETGGYLTLKTDTLITDTTLGTHHIVLVDASSNDVTITLPTGLLPGRVYQIKCIDLGATYTCDVDPNGNNIDGSASNFVLAEGESITVVMDASQDWWII